MDTIGVFSVPGTQQTPTTKLWYCTNCRASHWIESNYVLCACGMCGHGGDNCVCLDDDSEWSVWGGFVYEIAMDGEE